MSGSSYKDIVVTIKDRIGIIKFNRPQFLNSFGGNLLSESIQAIRELNEHPETVFTVLTGEGRFFCSGADVRSWELSETEKNGTVAQKKLAFMNRFIEGLEIMRSIIDHRKVFVLALNGPAVGAGAAWFPGVSDIVLASTSTYLQIPFSALGLVPECGSATTLSQSMGVHRANEFVMFGKKIEASELKSSGLVNQVFEKEHFEEKMMQYLHHMLKINDGKSMMEAKRLQNIPLRDTRMLAVYNSFDALAERFVHGAPIAIFAARKRDMEAKSRRRASKI